jgi:hypothetical protein
MLIGTPALSGVGSGTTFVAMHPFQRPAGRHALLGIAGVALGCPASALADVGTPMLWASTFHLLLGNALVGVFEGWLLAWVFGLPRKRSMGLMIVANYLSAWLGFLLLGSLFSRFVTDLESGGRITLLLVALAYALTLVVEWPLVALCFRGTPRGFGRSLRGSVLVQSASYLLLFGGYWMLSGTSLYTRMKVVPPDQIEPPHGVVMYFISSADGDLHRQELGQATDVRIAALGSTERRSDCLRLEASSVDSNRWDLVAVVWREKEQQRETVVLVPGITTWQQMSDKQVARAYQYGGWGNAALQIGTATNSHWRFRWTVWPDLGLWGNDGTRKFAMAFGTPFGGWSPYRAIELPGEKLLVQLEQRKR